MDALRPSGHLTAGVNDAKPGIVMEAHPAIGDFSRQEFDLGNAEDFAEVKSLSDTATVSAGKFTRCLRTENTEGQERTHSYRIQAKERD